jgi:hypothetical protein
MNPRRAEIGIQILSVLAIWATFFAVWGSKGQYLQALTARGADLPGPTLIWLEIAGSWIAFAVPLICTVLVIWTLQRGSIHANWIAGLVLLLATFYALAAHVAVVLPTFTMCGPV